jgi:hypothetical protein
MTPAVRPSSGIGSLALCVQVEAALLRMPPVLAMLTDGLSIGMTILRGLELSYGGPQAVLVREQNDGCEV